jgi:hypothetical protein
MDNNNSGTVKVFGSNGDFLWIEYWKNNRLHREDGPAVIFHDNVSVEYWLNDCRVTSEQVWDNMTTEQLEEALWNLDEWVK